MRDTFVALASSTANGCVRFARNTDTAVSEAVFCNPPLLDDGAMTIDRLRFNAEAASER